MKIYFRVLFTTVLLISAVHFNVNAAVSGDSNNITEQKHAYAEGELLIKFAPKSISLSADTFYSLKITTFLTFYAKS